MNKQNRRAGKIAAAVVAAASLFYGLSSRDNGMWECGSILFPGPDADYNSCPHGASVSPTLLWILGIGGIGVFIYLQMLDIQANNKEN